MKQEIKIKQKKTLVIDDTMRQTETETDGKIDRQTYRQTRRKMDKGKER